MLYLETPLQSTMPTGSEHDVGPRNEILLTHQDGGLNAKRLPNIPER